MSFSPPFEGRDQRHTLPFVASVTIEYSNGRQLDEEVVGGCLIPALQDRAKTQPSLCDVNRVVAFD